MTSCDLFDFSRTQIGEYLSGFFAPWEALPTLREAIIGLGRKLSFRYREVSPCVWIHSEAKIARSSLIEAPCIVSEGAEIRHGAYLRGGVTVGARCVVGNSSEIKNSVLFDGAKVPHFNYVGDSILGADVHLGADSICSNVRGDGHTAIIVWNGCRMDTGLRKCGAFLGDGTEIGCGCVLNPATVMGRRVLVRPLLSLSGFYPEGSVVGGSPIGKSSEIDSLRR